MNCHEGARRLAETLLSTGTAPAISYRETPGARTDYMAKMFNETHGCGTSLKRTLGILALKCLVCSLWTLKPAMIERHEIRYSQEGGFAIVNRNWRITAARQAVGDRGGRGWWRTAPSDHRVALLAVLIGHGAA